MNIDRDSKLEKHIAEIVRNRRLNSTKSSFEGENSFHEKITKMKRQ